jgi:hypothetical protein
MECIEYHCSGRATTHDYGAPECDWKLMADGEGIEAKSEAPE